MTEKVNERLREAIMTVVDNQLRDGDPPETKITFARLRGEGYSVDEAKRLIGMVVGEEVFNVLRENRKYDAIRFAERLRALPKFPWDGEEGEA